MVISIRRTTAPPSQLVTAIAWLSIVGSALSTFGTAVYLAVFTFAPGDVFRESAEILRTERLSAQARFAIGHLQLFLVISLLRWFLLGVPAVVGLWLRLPASSASRSWACIPPCWSPVLGRHSASACGLRAPSWLSMWAWKGWLRSVRHRPSRPSALRGPAFGLPCCR